jgi:hypothetical protein
MDREVIAGQEIDLRARFRDDLTEPAVASGVWLHIYEPGVDTSEEANAIYATSGELEYIGEGIWQCEYTTHSMATEGSWTDLWSGILNGQVITGTFNFYVYSEGEAEAIGNQLYTNNLIEVTLSSGIMATDGTYLTDGYSFQFLTQIDPAYTNIRKVKLEIGSYIEDLQDITLQLAILEASIEAGQITFEAERNANFYSHARREWTTCKTAFTLLDNVASHGLKAKTLDNLRVEYDTNAVNRTLMRIMDCLQKWEPQVIAGGYAKQAKQPVYVVKGEYDYDRPIVGRMWAPTTDTTGTSDRAPAANYVDKLSDSRRFEKVYKSKKKFW